MASWKTSNTRKITMVGMLSAVATVLMYLDFSIPLVPSFIKLDFSELPALLAAFALGPISGGAVCLVKNLVHLLGTSTGGVGELSNFLLGILFVVPAGIIYHRKKSRLSAFLGAVAGAAAMALLSVVTNYYIVYPIYYQFWPEDVVLGMYQAIDSGVGSIKEALWKFNAPFTFCKGMCSVIILFPLYKRLSPFLKGESR